MGKNVLIGVIYVLNFSFKKQFLRVSSKKPRQFSCVAKFISRVVHDCLSKYPIATKLFCPKKFLVTRLISHFNISINITIILDPKFSSVLKIFIILISHYKSFIKMFFHHITSIFTFFDYTADKIVNTIFTKV